MLTIAHTFTNGCSYDERTLTIPTEIHMGKEKREKEEAKKEEKTKRRRKPMKKYVH